MTVSSTAGSGSGLARPVGLRSPQPLISSPQQERSDLTVVVICRMDENPYVTLKSLACQTVVFDLVVVYDQGQGANWARNRGFAEVCSEFVLFSDNDIVWEPDALERLGLCLLDHAEASYAYGWYEMNGVRYCGEPFDPALLCRRNYISTMSLLRSAAFPGFDESILRLQDWDLWLSLLEQGKTGVYCEHKIFSTEVRPGITFDGPLAWQDAERIVKQKHGL